MAIFFIFIAALFVSISNFYMRKSIDSGGTTKAFLVFQMSTAFLVAVLLNPVKAGYYEFNAPIIYLGLFAGVILAAMLFALGKSLESGPPGLTFSVLNASTVMPGIIMALVFGASLGFPYTSWHGIGSVLVLVGLFWATRGVQLLETKRKWIVLTFSMFLLHTLILILFQWRALLLNAEHPEQFLSYFTKDVMRSQWFMPFMFLASAFIQLFLFIRSEKRWPLKKEVFYGVFGGAANGLCTYFMLYATEVATPLENAIIFPVFSVIAIILSNFWGQFFYQEKVNWRACQLASFGLIIGTVDWKRVAVIIGF